MTEYLTTYKIQQTTGNWLHIATVTHDSERQASEWIANQKSRHPNDTATFATRVVHYGKK
jgi:hypothetical protein